MREIKFRAWNDQEKKMIDLQKITPLAMDAALLSLGARGLFIPFDKDMILMQFTGLLDKNGKEIYEGDLIKYEIKGKERIDQVEYVSGCFIPDVWRHQTPEIVGNIWQTPELIRGYKA